MSRATRRHAEVLSSRRLKSPVRSTMRSVCVLCCAVGRKQLRGPLPVKNSCVHDCFETRQSFEIQECNCWQPTKYTGATGCLSFLTLRGLHRATPQTLQTVAPHVASPPPVHRDGMVLRDAHYKEKPFPDGDSFPDNGAVNPIWRYVAGSETAGKRQRGLRCRGTRIRSAIVVSPKVSSTALAASSRLRCKGHRLMPCNPRGHS